MFKLKLKQHPYKKGFELASWTELKGGLIYLLISEVSRTVSVSFQGIRCDHIYTDSFAKEYCSLRCHYLKSFIQSNVYIKEISKISDSDLEDIMYYNVIICCWFFQDIFTGRKLFQGNFLNDNRCCSYTTYLGNAPSFGSPVGLGIYQSAFSIGNYNLGPN